MKKIIENPNPKPTMTVTCPYCKCKFQFGIEDVTRDLKYRDEWGDQVVCPNCGELIITKE